MLAETKQYLKKLKQTKINEKNDLYFFEKNTKSNYHSHSQLKRFMQNVNVVEDVLCR